LATNLQAFEASQPLRNTMQYAAFDAAGRRYCQVTLYTVRNMIYQ